jgi:hypothetical protein
MLAAEVSVHAIETALLAVLPPALLLGDHALGDAAHGAARPRSLRSAYVALLCIAIATGGAIVARNAWRATVTPPDADLRGFWIWGRALVAGHNPYYGDALRAAAVGTPVVPSAVPFFDVGCVYPPPTLLLFAPLGWFSFRTAAALWTGLQLVALAVSIVLLWRLFFPDRGARGLALAAALAWLVPAGWLTLGDGQTNFLTLAFVLAAWRTRDRAVSGVYMASAAIVKPLYAVVSLYPLVRRRWGAVLASALTVTLATAAATVAFGTHTVLTYVRDNPAKRLPPSFFSTEWTNQSLAAMVVRFAPHQLVTANAVSNPVYLGLAALALAVTIWVAHRLPRTADGEDCAFALFVPTALLVYPATLGMYSVMLLPPLLLLWRLRRVWRDGTPWIALLAMTVYLVTYVDDAHFSVIATILVWVALVALGARLTTAHVDLAGQSMPVPRAA